MSKSSLDKHCESKYDNIIIIARKLAAESLLKLLNKVEQNISCEDIKAEVRKIYKNKSLSDEKKIRKIQAKIDEAKKQGFWRGAASVIGAAGVAAVLDRLFEEK